MKQVAIDIILKTYVDHKLNINDEQKASILIKELQLNNCIKVINEEFVISRDYISEKTELSGSELFEFYAKFLSFMNMLKNIILGPNILLLDDPLNWNVGLVRDTFNDLNLFTKVGHSNMDIRPTGNRIFDLVEDRK